MVDKKKVDNQEEVKEEAKEGIEQEGVKAGTKPEEAAVEKEEAAGEAAGAEVEKLKAEIEELKNKNLRMSAEFQNFKRRVEKEKADIYKFANEKMVVELLGVMDNLERAMESINKDDTDHTNVLDGVDLIKKTFENLLEKNGVKAIDSIGEPFDPEMHHAVMTEDSEEHDSDVVLQEFQKGYILNEKVVRPSMVKVSS